MARFSVFAGIGATLRQPNFAWYIGGSTIALIGMWGQRIAIGWLTWELTRSGAWLGIIAFADLFPTVIVTPIAGVVADRVDRRLMSLLSLILATVQAFALAALTWLKLIDIWILLGLTLILGIVLAVQTAARLAMVPNLLERQYVPSALAIDSATFNMARFIGPAIAGVVIASVGVAGAFLINALAYLAFVLALARARMIRSEVVGRGRAGFLSQTRDGLRYARGHDGIGPILVLLVAVAIGVKGFMELLPGVVDVVFGRGVTGLAYLTASAGVGAFLVAFWLAVRGRAQGLTVYTIGSMVVGAASVLVFAATDIFWIGLVGTFLAGAASTMCGTGTQTLMQNAVEGALRGRVMSLYGVLNRGAPALGALIMGTASEWIGFQAALLGGGAFTLLAVVWVLRRRTRMIAALEAEPAG